MPHVFNRSMKVGDIVNRFPGAAEVFKQYRIDFCCGGDRPLNDAVRDQNLDVDDVLENLHASYEKEQHRQNRSIDWTKASYGELIDHIIYKHHAFLKEELPLVSQYTTKIFRVHGLSHPELADVHRLFHQLKIDLEHHMEREEKDAFPLIRDYEHDPGDEQQHHLKQVIEDLEAEHDTAGDILKKLSEVTSDYTLPEDACGSYRLTYQKLKMIESDMFDHVHLENNVLFPRVMGS
ncbi:MAG: iron-sulfur cluster repair di-iron protein [Bacillaceae bacterium]|nr:iron-sulfur cluster repair di-iron protein [Bacillaceae bacterium]